MDRNLSGVFIRVKREKWESVDITDLTNTEMESFLNERIDNAEDFESEYIWVRDLCKILSKTIRKIGDDLDIIKGE